MRQPATDDAKRSGPHSMNSIRSLLRKMLTIWLVLGCLTVLLVPSASRASGAEPNRLPNIVFILADDMGSGDPGSFNKNSKIPTPNIDRLATDGIRFTDAHTPSSVCTPTRYGI